MEGVIQILYFILGLNNYLEFPFRVKKGYDNTENVSIA